MHPVSISSVSIAGADGGETVLRDLNYRREGIAAAAPLPIVVWVSPGQVRTFAEQAPDLWAWRGAVLDFAVQIREPLAIEREPLIGPLQAEREAVELRLGEIDAYLSGSVPRADTTADLLLEAAELHYSLGDWDGALTEANEALGRYRELDTARGAAFAQG